MNKFENKYRIPSTRAQWWDYGSNAPYFITICTKNREHFFGEIKNGKMFLSSVGKMANDYWQSRFHDHIIRNDDEFYRIKNYIANNPGNWKEDKFNR